MTRPQFNFVTDRRTFRVIASDYLTVVLLRPLLARLFDDAPSVSIDITPISPGYATTLEPALVDLLILPAGILEASLDDMTLPRALHRSVRLRSQQGQLPGDRRDGPRRPVVHDALRPRFGALNAVNGTA